MTLPLVMGVVNVTPDSFSDGGRFLDASAALAHARRLIAEGADMIDVGGESTRPGADPVAEAEEISRVVPLIRAVRGESRVRISIDTMKPAVARAAVAAELGCEVCLMHMQGDPSTMQSDPRYDDVVEEVMAFMIDRIRAAAAAGVSGARIWLDPGIGFGKRPEHNLQLLRRLDRFVETGFPVILGVSRKRFIRSIDETAVEAADRLGGSLAAGLGGAARGAAVLRVHDVRETVQALKVWAAIQGAS